MSAPPQAAQSKGAVTVETTDPVEIDRSNFVERHRYVCPGAEHSNWSRTNNHLLCSGCVNLSESGLDIDPEYYHIYDKRENRLIPWSHVVLIE